MKSFISAKSTISSKRRPTSRLVSPSGGTANPYFGTVVSESGGAYTWCENAHGYRLTPWNNDAVTDDIWREATRHYDENGLSAIILMIAVTNMFNRINATIKEPAGATWS